MTDSFRMQAGKWLRGPTRLFVGTPYVILDVMGSVSVARSDYART
jgi:hypothetical protein